MAILPIIYGFFWGFLLCFTFGPAFFAIVQVGFEQTYKKGAIMALGVVFADAILMFFAVFGTSFLPNISNYNQIISFSGATILLIMGFFTLFSNQKQLVYPSTKVGNFIYFFIKGTFLNLLNPANFLFVVSTCTYLKGVWHYKLNEIIAFFGASLLATLIAEVLIAIYASKIKKIASAQKIEIFNKIAGVVFILVALKMLYSQLLA